MNMEIAFVIYNNFSSSNGRNIQYAFFGKMAVSMNLRDDTICCQSVFQGEIIFKGLKVC